MMDLYPEGVTWVMLTKHYPERTVLARYYDNFDIEHKYDGHGEHRIEIAGRVGSWVDFASFSILKHEGITFVACTEHWWPDLPEIFVLQPIKEHEILDHDPEEDTHEPGESGSTIHPVKRMTLAEQIAAKKAAKEKGSSEG